ncbi:hypothetical protein [Hymenobacter tenuis]
MIGDPSVRYYVAEPLEYDQDMGNYPAADILVYYDTNNPFRVIKNSAGKVLNWIDRSGNGFHMSTASGKESSIELVGTRETIALATVTGSLVCNLGPGSTQINRATPYTWVFLVKRKADFGTTQRTFFNASGGANPFIYGSTFFASHLNSGYQSYGDWGTNAEAWIISANTDGTVLVYKTNANGTRGTVTSRVLSGLYNHTGWNFGGGSLNLWMFQHYTRSMNATEIIAHVNLMQADTGLTL